MKRADLPSPPSANADALRSAAQPVEQVRPAASGSPAAELRPPTPSPLPPVNTAVSGETDDGAWQLLLRDIAAAPALHPRPPGSDQTARLQQEIASRYTLGPRLGAGGMGVVYKAHDRVLHRDVALKILSDNLLGRAEAHERFVREAQMAARIVSPHVASVFELGTSEGGVFIAMELVEGKTLRALLREGVPSEEQAMRLGRQLCEGLAAAHAAGVIHRDLKPENVMVTPAGQPKILDFGLARLDTAIETDDPLAAPLTRSGMLMGTPPYMSPEQLFGDPPDLRSDVWSLGLMLYELFTGQRLFRERSVEDLRAATLSFDARSLAGSLPVPPGWVEVIIRCLAPREQRFRDAGEVLAALQSPRPLPPLATSQAAPAPPRSRARLLLLGALGLLGAIGLPLLLRWARPSTIPASKTRDLQASGVWAQRSARTRAPDGAFAHIDQLFLIHRLSPSGWSVNAGMGLDQPGQHMETFYITIQDRGHTVTITVHQFASEEDAERSRSTMANEGDLLPPGTTFAVLRRGRSVLAVGNAPREVSQRVLEQIADP